MSSPSPATATAPIDVVHASVPVALAAVGVDPSAGLDDREAEARLRAHGFNEVPPPREHPVLRFLSHFWGISAWMLELILIVSIVLDRRTEAVVVGALLVVNAVLAFTQERQSAAVVASLEQRLQVSARVRRGGRWRVIAARDLVPGDIVRLRGGDIVPADVKVIDGKVSADESTITGESAEVVAGEAAVLPSGSLIRSGEAGGLVMLTGAQTTFGRTTSLVQRAHPRMHIEEIVARVVRWLFVIVVSLLALVVVISMVRGVRLVEILPLLLVLLLSAVPVALPVMFTVSMAVGAGELAKRGVLVTRLSASEDAATMDVLCVDKTGTLTMNRLTVTEVLPEPAYGDADVLLAAAPRARKRIRIRSILPFSPRRVRDSFPISRRRQRSCDSFRSIRRRVVPSRSSTCTAGAFG